MKEDFLHYLWKYQFFALSNLKTTSHVPLTVVKSGEHNLNAGPDFFNAQVRLNGQLWAGTVEIHMRSSDWYVHGHEKDPAYDNVILHVVWEHDVEIYRNDQSIIPTLELQLFVDQKTLNNYQDLFSKKEKWIPCEHSIGKIDTHLWKSWLEKLYIERLQQKTGLIDQLLATTHNDWEAVLFMMLAKNLGLHTNGDQFLELAKQIDFKIVRKVKHQLTSLEALFFGMAGFLSIDSEEVYLQKLEQDFAYLSSKFELTSSKLPIQFFRLRPSNFPTIRIAQLAMLYHTNDNLFSKVISITEINEFYTLFKIGVSEFWKTHYSFTASSKASQKSLSKDMIDLIIINTILPLKFVYMKATAIHSYETLFDTARQLKPEKNSIVDKFKALNISAESAFDTQALLQLKNEYCTNRKCLQCNLGCTILKNT